MWQHTTAVINCWQVGCTCFFVLLGDGGLACHVDRFRHVELRGLWMIAYFLLPTCCPSCWCSSYLVHKEGAWRCGPAHMPCLLWSLSRSMLHMCFPGMCCLPPADIAASPPPFAGTMHPHMQHAASPPPVPVRVAVFAESLMFRRGMLLVCRVKCITWAHRQDAGCVWPGVLVTIVVWA